MQKLQAVALVAIGDVGDEPIAIRSSLEYFGFRLIYYPIGRPNDLINVLNGNALYHDISDVIICAHGKDGALVMPDLAASIYEVEEPRGNFDAAQIMKFGKLKGKTVLTTGCKSGIEVIGKAFLNIGCKYFIGATEDVEGSAALLFVQHYYYQIAKGASVQDAWASASRIDEQTNLFKLYYNQSII